MVIDERCPGCEMEIITSSDMTDHLGELHATLAAQRQQLAALRRAAERLLNHPMEPFSNGICPECKGEYGHRSGCPRSALQSALDSTEAPPNPYAELLVKVRALAEEYSGWSCDSTLEMVREEMQAVVDELRKLEGK